MRNVAFVSFRLGGSDGVSVEADKWMWAFDELGFAVITVAAEGVCDRTIDGLAIDPPEPPDPAALCDEVVRALYDADVVVVENLCSLPLNPVAYNAVAHACASRRTIMHHHDIALQRSHLSHFGVPANDGAWIHVTINALTKQILSDAGIGATVVYNRFDPDPVPGDRMGLRQTMGIDEDTWILMQPTRAIARKNIPGALALCRAVADHCPAAPVYWLVGDAEDGYGPTLDQLLAGCSIPIRRGLPPQWGMSDAYAACDAVVFPSTWEGFGNPAIESAVHRKPLVIGEYPVGRELQEFGFQWFGLNQAGELATHLEGNDGWMLDTNHSVARKYFGLDDLPGEISALMSAAGWDG